MISANPYEGTKSSPATRNDMEELEEGHKSNEKPAAGLKMNSSKYMRLTLTMDALKLLAEATKTKHNEISAKALEELKHSDCYKMADWRCKDDMESDIKWRSDSYRESQAIETIIKRLTPPERETEKEEEFALIPASMIDEIGEIIFAHYNHIYGESAEDLLYSKHTSQDTRQALNRMHAILYRLAARPQDDGEITNPCDGCARYEDVSPMCGVCSDGMGRKAQRKSLCNPNTLRGQAFDDWLSVNTNIKQSPGMNWSDYLGCTKEQLPVIILNLQSNCQRFDEPRQHADGTWSIHYHH